MHYLLVCDAHQTSPSLDIQFHLSLRINIILYVMFIYHLFIGVIPG